MTQGYPYRELGHWIEPSPDVQGIALPGNQIPAQPIFEVYVYVYVLRLHVW